jgi:hypothetical protein
VAGAAVVAEVDVVDDPGTVVAGGAVLVEAGTVVAVPTAWAKGGAVIPVAGVWADAVLVVVVDKASGFFLEPPIMTTMKVISTAAAIAETHHVL